VAAVGAGAGSGPGPAYQGSPMPGNRFAAFRTLSVAGDWTPPDHTPSDIVTWAGDLQPDVFWRTFTMSSTFSLERDVGDGYTTGSFLDAVAKAASGYHTPRINVDPGLGVPDSQILDWSSELLDMSLTPKLQYLSIDNYVAYLAANGEDHTKQFFTEIFNQGWSGIDFLICATPADPGAKQRAPPPCFGLASSLGYQIPKPTTPNCGVVGDWDVGTVCQGLIKQTNPGPRQFMALDEPAEGDCFKELTPDEMADVLDIIGPQQASDGFVFVWPVIHETPNGGGANAAGQWDSSAYILKSGESLYTVEKGLMVTNNPKS
jgi:hypothetical protein